MIVIGFTGTQRGLTDEQERTLKATLRSLKDVAGAVEFHHGDCIGADNEAHGVAALLGAHKIVVHPPEVEAKRARVQVSPERDEVLAPKPYLDRNHDIVDACHWLIACPGEAAEKLRSGTWATVRYARKTGKGVLVILPDGTLA